MGNDEVLEAMFWVRRGRRRKQVFLSLKQAKLPSEICMETNMCFSCISRSLTSFRNRGLVRILDLDTNIRPYALTYHGHRVIEELQTAESPV